jgi:hypothetical protein
MGENCVIGMGKFNGRVRRRRKIKIENTEIKMVTFSLINYFQCQQHHLVNLKILIDGLKSVTFTDLKQDLPRGLKSGSIATSSLVCCCCSL